MIRPKPRDLRPAAVGLNRAHMPPLFGRTNKAYPPVWLSLQQPWPSQEGAAEKLAEAALAAETVLDLSSSLSRWGSLLRGSKPAIALFVGREVEGAGSAESASSMVAASLISQLSCLGRDNVEFCFLPVRRALEEHQINGALEAMESARSDGLVNHFGLSAAGSAYGVLSTWQFHDAFEAIMIPMGSEGGFEETLAPMAQTRRVGICACQPLSWGARVALCELPAVRAAAEAAGVDAAQALLSHSLRFGSALLGVRSPEQIPSRAAAPPDPGAIAAIVAAARAALADPREWSALAADPRPWVRAEASRRSA